MKPTKPNKILAVALAGILLSGCASKPDEVAQKMIDDINAIGTVEVSDEEAIEKAEKIYATLTEKQKEQVSNYADLLNARDELDALLKEKVKQEAEAEEQARLEIEKKAEEDRKAEEERKAQEEKDKLASYTPEVKYCARAIITVKRALKNEESLIINGFYYSDISTGKFVNLDITSQNGFGGSNRDIVCVTENIERYNLEIITHETEMGMLIDNSIVDSDMIYLFDQNDGVESKDVLELVDEYEKTKDKSLLY